MECLTPVHELMYRLEFSGKRPPFGWQFMTDEDIYQALKKAYPEETKKYPELMKKIGLYLVLGINNLEDHRFV